jgi:hypothetical protein
MRRSGQHPLIWKNPSRPAQLAAEVVSRFIQIVEQGACTAAAIFFGNRRREV